MAKKVNSFEQKVKIIFGSYKEAKEFHFTSDGQAFSQLNDAKNHAKTLEDKEVTRITRAMATAGDLNPSPKAPDAPKAENGAKNEFQAKGVGNEAPLSPQMGGTEESAKEPVKEPGKEEAPPAPQVGGDESPNAQEGSKQPAKEPAKKEPVKEPVKEPAKAATVKKPATKKQ